MKKVIICLLIIISSVVFIGCSKDKSTTAPAKTITIGLMPDVESIPLVIAEKNGYFEKEGLNVKLEHFKSAKDRDSALQSGKLDGVISDILAVVFANEGGIDLRIIAKTDGNIKLLAGKGSAIDSLDKIKGKRIGMSTNTIMEYSVDKMLQAAQIKPEDVKKENIPQLPIRLEMLQGARVDTAILPEPLAGLGIKNGATILSSTDQLGSKAGAIAFTAKSLQENPTEIKAIFRAYNEAVKYLQKEPFANYADYVIEKQGFPTEIKDSLKLPQYTYAQLPEEKVFNDVVKWLLDKKLIKKNYEYKAIINEDILR